MAKTFSLEDGLQILKKGLAGSGITVSRETPTTTDQPMRPKRPSTRNNQRRQNPEPPDDTPGVGPTR